MKVKRGDVIYLKEDFPMKGHIQGGKRPFVVISNNLGNTHSDICIVVPLTGSKHKHSLPTHTQISFNNSLCLCEQIFTVSQYDVETIKFHLTWDDMKKINQCLKNSLDLG